MPRRDYDIVDTWFTSGMRGTGSKDIVVREAYVPQHRIMDPSRAGDGEWTGWELHRRLSYRLPFRCMTGWDLLVPLIGIAQGAVDEFTSRERPAPAGRPIQRSYRCGWQRLRLRMRPGNCTNVAFVRCS
jgi:hypothetical protein